MLNTAKESDDEEKMKWWGANDPTWCNQGGKETDEREGMLLYHKREFMKPPVEFLSCSDASE